jgi:hypothetical protein
LKKSELFVRLPQLKDMFVIILLMIAFSCIEDADLKIHKVFFEATDPLDLQVFPILKAYVVIPYPTPSFDKPNQAIEKTKLITTGKNLTCQTDLGVQGVAQSFSIVGWRDSAISNRREKRTNALNVSDWTRVRSLSDEDTQIGDLPLH